MGFRRRALTVPHIRQQPAEFLLDRRVALAGAGGEAVAVEHRDVAAAVLDEACLLQPSRRFGDALAPHPEHARDEFLGHDQFARVDAIESQQEPAAQLLLDRMMAVAGRGLGHLRDQRLGVAQQQALHRAAAVEFLFEQLALQPVGVSRGLHHGRTGRGVAAHEERDADHAFVAHARGLGRCAVSST
jgi:hypothetical protein